MNGGESTKSRTSELKGQFVDSAKRGYDPKLRKYRLVVYTAFGLGFTWFCAGMFLSVVDYLFGK